MQTDSHTHHRHHLHVSKPTLALAAVAVAEVFVVAVTALAAFVFALIALFEIAATGLSGAVWMLPSLLCAIALVFTLRFGVRVLRRTGFPRPDWLVVGGLVSGAMAGVAAQHFTALAGGASAVPTVVAVLVAVVAFFLFGILLTTQGAKRAVVVPVSAGILMTVALLEALLD